METHRRANLHEELPDRVPVVHGVECGNLVDSHWRYFQDPCYFVHDTDTREAMLPLAEIEKGHDSCLLVLRGVPLEDLIDEGKVLIGEFEGNSRVVFGAVAMLRRALLALESFGRWEVRP